jgi:uncharacterized protein YbaP (TraB family)
MLNALLSSGARRLVALLLVFFAANSAFAADRHSLWAVKGKQNTVYLFGSLHMLPPNEVLPAEVETAYKDSKKLVMEIDLDDMRPEASLQLMMELGMLPAGQSLGQQISAADATKLEAVTKEIGVPAGMLQPYRPWLAAVMLTQLQLRKLGFDPDSGVEQRFVAKAKADRKEIVGLESLGEQLHLLADLPPKLQTQFLRQTLEEAGKAEKEIGSMLKAWRTGDSAGLEALVLKGVKDFPELYRPLTIDRNKKWLGKVEALLAVGENQMVIVGALHLVGKDGLVELLKSKGYKVEQL